MPARRRRGRRGVSLMEVMVVIAIGMALILVAIPAVSSIMKLEQAKAAKTLALTIRQLRDDAVLRNTTYRIAFHLEDGYYVVEEGDPTAMIFASKEAKEEAEKQAEEDEKRDEDLISMYKAARDKGNFSQAGETLFKTKVQLPDSCRFAGVYTPQYGEMVEPGDRDDDDEPVVVYSYMFGNGMSEHTLIHIVDVDDEDDGYTIQVEPLSGQVTLLAELIDPLDAFDFVPDEGPDLSD